MVLYYLVRAEVRAVWVLIITKEAATEVKEDGQVLGAEVLDQLH
jgi:hypothetical protein